MEIYLLRHGQTDWNKEKKLQGRTDVLLNETGIAQAKEAAKYLKDIDFDIIYSSPLSRAINTAEIIAEGRTVPIVTDERLTEMCFGAYEETENYLTTLKIFTAPEEYYPTDGGESFEQVRKRAKDFLDEIKSKHYERILIVSHGAFCRSLLCLINDVPIKDTWNTPPMPNCKAIIFNLKSQPPVKRVVCTRAISPWY